MRFLFLVAIFFVAFTTQAREPLAVDFRCLIGGDKQNIHLEWRVFSEPETGWTTAYVKYHGGSKPIPLVQKSEEATQKPEGRPWEMTSIWLEVMEGKITGEYRVVTQGANIYRFQYKNHRNGKEMVFVQDLAAQWNDGCEWKR
ncbi:hypothetical protein [Azohydromonas caseinilytica]|uniref:Uncharacterized protein n=1 Tax=Azohydromonas caseinilytica TaxID=2728836 RepID=A0A848FF70_9BURK|nr:hypothetical protein [Azohydromonas caseinilytica]NML17485.1 hypothetical protein [Azohydromonas caseinilytica]